MANILLDLRAPKKLGKSTFATLLPDVGLFLSSTRRKHVGGSTMELPLPTMDEFLRFAEKANAQRKATAERLLKDRVMTREELIKHGLLSDNDVN
jgi:hypothetical protein